MIYRVYGRDNFDGTTYSVGDYQTFEAAFAEAMRRESAAQGRQPGGMHDRFGVEKVEKQECDIHAAEPAGVIHEPKEPRRAARDFEREHFEQALGCYRQSILDTLADEADPSMTREDVANARRREAKELDEVMSRWDTEHDAAKELAAERDEWKRRAEEEGGLARKAESLAARKLVEYAALDIEMDEIAVALGYAEEHEGHVMRAPHSTLLRVIAENARTRGEAEDERDIALRLVEDPRVKAWRALDGEVRFAIRRGLFVAGHNEAAAALEALEEKS